MRALVTGGAGFIGSHIVERFLGEGYQVRVLDSLEPRVHPLGLRRQFEREVEFIHADVSDRSAWERALEGVDVVSHHAAYQDYMLDFSKFVQVNALGTALLYEVLVARKLRPRKVIVASSQAVYGEGQYQCPQHGLVLPHGRPQEQLQAGRWEVCCPQCGCEAQPQLLREQHPNPCNQYAVSKMAQEQIALGLGRIHQIPTVSLRYSITQGPRQSLFNQYSGILRIFYTRARQGEPLIIYEDGNQTRDFVHIADVVDANFLVLEKAEADYQAFNVGSGRPTKISDYAFRMLERVGSNIPVTTPGQYRVGDNRHSISCIAKLQALGWRPQRGLAEIFTDFFAWVGAAEGASTGTRGAYAEMVSRGVVQNVSCANAAKVGN